MKTAKEDSLKDEVKKEVKKERVKTEKENEQDKLNKEIQDILSEHGNLESNIPSNHVYWGMCNRLRALMNEEKG